MLTDEKIIHNHTLLSTNTLVNSSAVKGKKRYNMGELYFEDMTNYADFIKIHYSGLDLYIPKNICMDAIIGFTKDLTIFHWSTSAEQLLGYSREEVIGTTIDRLVPDNRREEFNEKIQRLNHGEGVKNFEAIRRCKNGKAIYVDISITPIYQVDGIFYGAIATYRDISEKRRLMDQLIDSEERWRNAIQGGKFGVWELSLKTNIFRFYNQWYSILGIQDGELENTFEDWLRLVHRDDVPKVLDAIMNAKQGMEYVCEFRMYTKERQHIWVRGKGKIIQWNDQGEPVNMIGTNEDITDRKLIEEQLAEKCRQLEQSKQEAEQANRAKTNFLSNISHEIRTPMNGIVGLLQLLNRTRIDSKQTKWLEMLKESVDILTVLINNLLDISKIEAGKLELENNNFNLKMLSLEIYNQLSILCKPKRLDAKFFFDPKLKHMVIGDKIRIKQILLNLVNNAVKFTDHGLIAVEACLLYSDDYTEKIEFKVEDTGIGIADNEIEKIFGSFIQGDLSTKKKYMGTGLGLAISKKLALLMNGDIYVDSIVGKGSSFRFVCTLPKLKIPTKVMEMSDENQAIEEPVSQPVRSIVENIARDEIILSVEDNEINQEIIEAMIRNCGFHLLTAYNGEEALKLLEKYHVNLILMDVQMPVMNGYELTKIIRSLERYRDIPIIATTAYAMEADRIRCLEVGMNDFIPKPIGFENLSTAINKFLKANKMSTI